MRTDLKLLDITELTMSLQEAGCDLNEDEVLHWLRDRGYLVSQQGKRYNAPSDLAVSLGYMQRSCTVSNSYGGGTLVVYRPMLTQRGWEHLYPKILRYTKTRHDLCD